VIKATIGTGSLKWQWIANCQLL